LAAGVTMLKHVPLAVAAGFLALIGQPPECAALASDCRHVAIVDANGKAVHGIEDIVVDAGAKVAYLAADDRWAVEARAAQGDPVLPQGGIYLLRLDDASLRSERMAVADLTRQFKTESVFHPHGIDLVFDAQGRGTLYVVNRRYQRRNPERGFRERGGRWEVVPTVEIFDVGEAGALDHRRTVRSRAFCRANDVAGLDRGRFLVTNEGTACGRWERRLEQALDPKRGNVMLVELEDATGAAATRALAEGIGFANGLALDGQHLYVAATRDQALLVYRRDGLNGTAALGAPERIIAVDGGPDNLSWASEHVLLVAVHPSLLRLAVYRYRWTFGRMSWFDTAPTRMLAVDVRDGAQRVVWDSEAGEPLSAATVAVRHGDLLIAGSITDAGLLVCQLNRFEN
jgi:sugar lactone lactonase YvrE